MHSSFRTRTHPCKWFNDKITTKISKYQPPRTTVLSLITRSTEWLKYQKRIRLQETANLQRWVLLLWCCTQVVYTEHYFGAYLSLLFRDLTRLSCRSEELSLVRYTRLSSSDLELSLVGTVGFAERGHVLCAPLPSFCFPFHNFLEISVVSEDVRERWSEEV